MQFLESQVWRDHRPNPPATFAMAIFGEIQHALDLNLWNPKWQSIIST